MRIIISDEGAGFDLTRLKHGSVNGGGFGLWSIHERIHLIGGSFDIESTPGKGSCFSITILPSV